MVATASSARRASARRVVRPIASALAAAATGTLLTTVGVPTAAAHTHAHRGAGHHHRHASAHHHGTAGHHHGGSGRGHGAGHEACADAGTTVAHATHAQMQSAVVCLVNEQRALHHLPALRADTRLDHSAQTWTNAMISNSNFSHGNQFQNRISAAGFNWSNVGENIATGFRTPQGVVRAWMASTGHCQNILSPSFREVGTGVSDGEIRATSNVLGTWTQDFGLLMGQHPASHDTAAAAGCPFRI